MANRVRAVGGSLGGPLLASAAASVFVDGASPVIAGHSGRLTTFTLRICMHWPGKYILTPVLEKPLDELERRYDLCFVTRMTKSAFGLADFTMARDTGDVPIHLHLLTDEMSAKSMCSEF